MIIFKKLPFDLQYYIYEIHCTKIIIKNVRLFMVRHTRRKYWKSLLKNILDNASTFEMKKLMSSYWIRNEWRCEPESWFYTINNDPEQIKYIAKEL